PNNSTTPACTQPLPSSDRPAEWKRIAQKVAQIVASIINSTMESRHTTPRYELARSLGPSEPSGIASMSCFARFLLLVCLIAISATAAGARLEGAPGQDTPRNSEPPLAQARALLADDKVEQAERTVRGYLVQYQTSADAHFLLGLILFRKIRAEALEER